MDAESIRSVSPEELDKRTLRELYASCGFVNKVHDEIADWLDLMREDCDERQPDAADIEMASDNLQRRLDVGKERVERDTSMLAADKIGEVTREGA